MALQALGRKGFPPIHCREFDQGTEQGSEVGSAISQTLLD